MLSATTSTVKAQVDTALKMQAEETLKALGLDMTSAFRMFLSQVVLKGGIPFEVSLPAPNRATLAAISDSYAGRVHKADSVDELFSSLDD
jgi:DNA-damage-inducible protein J